MAKQPKLHVKKSINGQEKGLGKSYVDMNGSITKRHVYSPPNGSLL